MVLTANNPIRVRVHQSAVIRPEGGLSTLTFHAMGTRCRVLTDALAGGAADTYFDHLLNWVADFEAAYSRYLDTSLVSRINAAAGREWVDVDQETDRLLDLCAQLSFFTRGAFDPTALPLIRLWNWKANPPQVPDARTLERTREVVGWNKVQRRPGAVFLSREGMCLDFGGIGKEYAVDVVVSMARQYGIENVLVDFGQDLRVIGKPPGRPAWHVGLEDPRNPGTCWGSVGVANHAVASSGDYLRHFVHGGRRYGHIIDPRTGCPVDNGCLSVNVVAPTCTVAGILSTSAFILGAQEGYHLINGYHGASGAITTTQTTTITPRFNEYLIPK